ncbi:hypothetical protein U713_03890 [Rhodobacter capsulatus YW2]|nr:hypothetical protein U713_03890 [Rhodobacter capsulatus YW2]
MAAQMSAAMPDENAKRWRILTGVFAFMLASSVPMSFFYYVFPPMLRASGHSAELVSALALVYLPYVLRGLWAFAIARALGGRAQAWRRATLALSVLAAAGVLALLPLDPARQPGPIMAVAAVLFLVLASGMTTLDGYVLATLGEKGRAAVPGWGAAGMALAGILVGVASWLGWIGGDWRQAVWLLAVMTLAPALAVAILPPQAPAERADPATPPRPRLPLRSLWRAVWQDPALPRLVLVSLLAHGAIGLVSGYLPVLQVDAGLQIGEIGLFSAVAANGLGLAGAVIGGAIVARIGGWKSLSLVTMLLALSLGVAAALHGLIWGRGFAVALTAVTMLAGYIYYVPYRALCLQSSRGDHAVTQAAWLSSCDMVVSILAMSVAGTLAARLGLVPFLVLCTLAASGAALVALRQALPARAALAPN